MRNRLSYAGAVAVAIVLAGFGDQPVEVARRYSQINQKYFQSLRAQRSFAAMRRAVKERDEALRKLTREAESVDPKQLSVPDLTALANAYVSLRQYQNAVGLCKLAIERDPKKEAVYQPLIRSLVLMDKLADAEAAFKQAKGRFPQSAAIGSLEYLLYSSNARHGRWLAAADHLASYLHVMRRGALRSSSTGSYFVRLCRKMVQSYQGAGKPERALAALEQHIAAIEQARAERPTTHLGAVQGQLQGTRASLLADMGKAKEAAASLDRALQQAQAEAKKNPDSVDHILYQAWLLGAQADLLERSDPEAADKARSDYLAFVAEQTGKHPGSGELLQTYESAYSAAVSALAKAGRAKQARKVLDSAIRFLDQAPEAELRLEAERVRRSLQRLESQIVRAELIGQSFIPFEPDAWVNGEPLSMSDLEGKVVLLDFWAVWCGPCRATFPHLRRWHHDYAQKGLVIIGLTRYYSYDWDPEQERPKRVRGLSHEKEQAALVAFARHYQLQHRFAIMPKGSEVAKRYGVTGIPQVVLIDRQGKIRLIRVGSGERNARDIEQMLEQLLAEPTATSAKDT